MGVESQGHLLFKLGPLWVGRRDSERDAVRPRNPVSIVGNVTDSSGAAVPGTEVTVTNQGSRIVVKTTGTAGTYTVPSLLAGTYSVSRHQPPENRAILSSALGNSAAITCEREVHVQE
jgi:hypothetical protein